MVVFPLLCEQVQAPQWMIPAMNAKVEVAPEVIGMIYDTFDKDLELTAPFFYNEVFHRCDRTHYQDMYHPYWYHPDHLGSSSYITNLDGEINQHLEYLPFGEALVEEHLSSYNSPFKFNAKELDAETGNYYYGARYYSQKYNLMLSVDPANEMYPGVSPYAYTLQNPIRYVDPTGMYVESPDDIVIRMRNEKGDMVEAFRIHTDLVDVEIDLEGTYSGTEPKNIYLDEVIQNYTCNVGEEYFPDAVALNFSGEASYKFGVQMELSLLAITKGDNKGDFGITLQSNGLAGIEGGITGSITGFYTTKPNSKLDVFTGVEIGLQADIRTPYIVSVGGAYHQGHKLQNPFAKQPFTGIWGWRGLSEKTYDAVSFGLSGGVVPIPVTFSGYLGISDYLYRSDK